MAAKTDAFRYNVRQFMRLRRMTQDDLAVAANLSRPWVCKMLNGHSTPNLETCEWIAKALDTSLEALLAEPEPTASSAA